uniref:GST N-terminal domain-containing protein n=1 Tax=Sciurus vulgaris TaxID=55149 RepID=A0A8D2B497_SCIVU
MSSKLSVVLGYGDIRGLVHVIRLLLEFTDTSYEEKQYVCGEQEKLLVLLHPVPRGLYSSLLIPISST